MSVFVCAVCVCADSLKVSKCECETFACVPQLMYDDACFLCVLCVRLSVNVGITFVLNMCVCASLSLYLSLPLCVNVCTCVCL